MNTATMGEAIGSHGLCRFCKMEGIHKHLMKEYNFDGVCEVYYDLLQECFNLYLSTSAHMSSLICGSCVNCLRDCLNFRKMVLASETQLIDMLDEKNSVFLNMDESSKHLQLEIKSEQEPAKEETFGEDDVIADGQEFDELPVDTDDEDATPLIKVRAAMLDEEKQMARFSNLQRPSKKRTLRFICKDFELDILKDTIKTELLVEPKKNTYSLSQKTSKERTVKKQNYPKENLLRAVDDVWNNKLTQTQAAKYYKVPRSTIFDLLIKNYGKTPPKLGQKNTSSRSKDESSQEMVKHTTNILTIMENSNATPIRCHGDGGYMCCFCDRRYLKPVDLKTHTIHSHDLKTKQTFTKGKRPSSYFVKLDISFLKCTVCNSNIDSLENLLQHLAGHGKKLYTDIKNHILPFKFESDELKCVVCMNVFNRFKVLQEHLNVHYPNYVCGVCGSGFVSRMILHNHSQGHNTGVFNCDQCSKIYNTERKLKSHQKLVHMYSYMASKCGYCNARFKSYHKKMEHLTKVHNVRMEFTCKACEKSFNSQAMLRIHRKRDHLMERKYKCSECDMRFFAKATVDFHMLKHSGFRNFQCDVCKKFYKRKATLREHIRIHENNRRFKCDQCGASFVQKCSWRGHMRSKHGVIT